MWNWMASSLTVGATLILYEGSVTFPSIHRLWQLLASEKVTVFGTSPKFIAACMAEDLTPSQILGDHTLKALLSTGSPLLPEQFSWVYSRVQKDLHLASISGGTDIVSCFMLGNPLMPVRSGEIQYPGLGMDVESWNDEGRPVQQEKGDLVCKSPFPAMPIGFWHDSDGTKYRKAYFSNFKTEVWCHGDYIEITKSGGVIVYGRSDATLNPGGIRIGTAELYRQVETLPFVLDSVAAALKVNGDDLVSLFIKLKPGISWSETLKQEIKTLIRKNLTPRHVPTYIEPVADIPYTRSGKKVELAVCNAINNQQIKNVSAMQNPEALEEYRKLGKKLINCTT